MLVKLRFAITVVCCFLFVGVQAHPHAHFSADAVTGCAPLTVHFTNTSDSATSYHWSFGDTTASTADSPSHVFYYGGTYTVTLTAYNGTDTNSTSIVITIPPLAAGNFNATDTAGCPGQTVHFTNTTTGGTTWAWNFGDGNTSTLSSPAHTYSNPGHFNVTLTAYNSVGCAASLTRNAYVDIYTPAAIVFGVVKDTICAAPATVVFTNSSTGTGTLNYVWSFGDGSSTVTTATPTHIYTAAGSYHATLRVTDGQGCTDSLTATEAIFVDTLAHTFTSPAAACIYERVLMPNSFGGIWFYGDGSIPGSEPEGDHHYTTAGTYTIWNVAHDYVCADTAFATITIYPEPTTNFISTPEPCPAPVDITFTPTGTPADTLRWTFGDGTTGISYGDSTIHTYTFAVLDTYANYIHTYKIDTVQLIATDAHGCRDTVHHIDTVYNLLQNFDIQGFCIGGATQFVSYPLTTVPFLDTTLPYPYAMAAYLWVFGDGDSSTSATPSHVYPAIGVYHGSCTITTANGCSRTDSFDIPISTQPMIDSVGVTSYHICRGQNIGFAAYTSDSAQQSLWFMGDNMLDPSLDLYAFYTYAHPGTYTVLVSIFNAGCASPLFVLPPITVDSPAAIFASHYDCSPATQVNLASHSEGADSLLWIFNPYTGGTETATGDSVSYDYGVTGRDTVMLVAYNAASGCHDTATLPLYLSNPVSTFFTLDSVFCKHGMVHIVSSSTEDTVKRYEWFLNDSLYIRDSTFVFGDSIMQAGLYTVTLVTTDEHGCTDTITHPNYLLVGGPTPVIHEIGLTCDSALVVLTDTASTDAPGLTYTGYWDYGDGHLDTGNVVMHQYKIADSITAVGYEYVVIVTDNIGCSSTAMGQIVVRHPVAGFVPSTYFPCIGSPVFFDNTTIFFPVPASTHMVYQWTFGDGSAVDTNHSPTHAYTDTGSYTVQLIATDASGTGCSDTITHVLRVNQPAAGFYMPDSTGVCVPHTVHFVNTSTGSTGLTMTYAWAFGNGNTSALSTPTNSYDTAGVYTVTLTATDSNGCSSTATGHVQVFGYTGAFTDIPPTGCAPLAVLFHAAGSGVADTITWDFRDSTATVSYEHTDSSLLHVFVNAGYYVPRLILKSNEGCSSVSYAADTVKVYGAPKVSASASAGSVCTGLSVTLTATDTAAIATSYTWYGTTGSGMSGAGTTGATQTVTPTGSGTFVYTVIATTEHGCSDTATVSVTTGTANVTVAGGTSLCMGSHETLTASNTGGGTMTYAWTPTGIGVSPTTGASVVFTPTVSGVYTIIATGTNGGCTDTGVLVVTVSALPTAAMSGTGNVCLGSSHNLTFTGTPNATVTYHRIGSTDTTVLLNSSGTAIVTLTPTVAGTTVYAMAGATSAQGCWNPFGGTGASVTAYAQPVINASNDTGICAGTSATLTVTGGTTYSWSPGTGLSGTTGASVTAHPATATTYTVTGTNSTSGCTNKDSVTITVNNIIAEDATLCDKAGDTLNATGATSFVWSGAIAADSSTLSCTACLHPVATPTVTTKYIATGNNGCKDTMTVVVPTEACGPCKSFHTKPFHTIASTSSPVSSLIAGENYYFANNVVVQNVNGPNSYGPHVEFKDNVIYMEKGISVTVQKKTRLDLNHDNLFSCLDMWKGIILENTNDAPPLMAKLRVYNGTLIEDAQTGVNITCPTAGTPPGYNSSNDTTYALWCDGAIFNKDSVGIYIANNYSSSAASYNAANTDTVMAYKVRNSVFTSRDFGVYNSAGGTAPFPLSWPRPDTGVGSLKGNWSPGSQFEAPYNIYNPVAINGNAYNTTTCNNGLPARLGIYLRSTGGTGLATDTSKYWGVIIGDTTQADSNRYMNLFDNLDSIGVYSYNSNATIYNSTFSKMRLYGIASYVVAGAQQYYQLRVLGHMPGITSRNSFYNCGTGIYTFGNEQAICLGSLITSDHDISNYTSGTNGAIGIYASAVYYLLIDIEGNDISNVKTGINYHMFSASHLGEMVVSHNTISACPACTTLGSTYVDQGILITGVTPGGGAVFPGSVHVEHNSMEQAFRPISVNNFTKTQVIINHNYAKMLYNSSIFNPAPLYGIECISCNGNIITNNEVRGPNSNSPTQGSTYSVARLVGIHISGNTLLGTTKPLIQCNLTDTINVGIQFDGFNSLIWKGNTMRDTRYGMVLYKASATSVNDTIGTQGSSSIASDNVWDSSSTWSTLGGNVMTYLNFTAVSSTVSPLFTRTYIPYNPTANGGTPVTNTYTTSNGSITLVTPTDTIPFMCLEGYGKMTSGQGHTNTNSSAIQWYEQIATGQPNYLVNVNGERWMAQMAVWEAVQQDSTLADSSTILYQFKAMAENGRYALLTSIGSDIANNNLGGAQAKLAQDIDAIANTTTDSTTGVVMQDDIGADFVVNNYRSYYSLYLKYINNTLNADDSAQVNTLALKCPTTDGMVIYNARNLYTMLYGDARAYADDCDDVLDSTAYRKLTNGNAPAPNIAIVTKDQQQYNLRPNPSDGNIMLAQIVQDDEPVNARVWSIAGISIFNSPLYFTGKKAGLNLKGIPSGLYMLELLDSKGRRFNYKFVVD